MKVSSNNIFFIAMAMVMVMIVIIIVVVVAVAITIIIVNSILKRKRSWLTMLNV